MMSYSTVKVSTSEHSYDIIKTHNRIIFGMINLTIRIILATIGTKERS